MYLLIVLIVAFGLISLTLTHSVKRLIGDNAYTQTQIFAENIPVAFEKEMLKLESIPEKTIHLAGCRSWECLSVLPEILLVRYPQLISCSLHGNVSDTDTASHHHWVAVREDNGEIRQGKTRHCIFRPPTKRQIIRQSEHGCWIHSTIRQEKTLAFCYPLYDASRQASGFLKLDFPQKTITDLICNCGPYPHGHLFLVDSYGNYLVPPAHQTNASFSRHTPYFVHYAPIPYLNWQLGIVCPSCNTSTAIDKLYWIVFICLSGGMLFLFIGSANIIRRLSAPLKQLSHAARQIAEGRFDTPIPDLQCSTEIQELCNSFRYLQCNLIDYIEKLKISTAEKEQRNSEMNLARKIQQRFLPHRIALPPNIQLAAELRQSREVGGDLYEFFIMENRLYFAIGDVAGKGTPAALYMVSVSRLLRYVACTQNSTAQICNIINKHMCEDSDDEMYITMFIGILDIRTGMLTYTNAGHPFPLIIHENGMTRFLDQCPDVPIGILENYYFTEHTYIFSENHSILFYTDGVTDAENPEGEFFGKEKLVDCIQKMATAPPRQIIRAILKDITKHTGTRKATDDMTLLLVRFTGTP